MKRKENIFVLLDSFRGQYLPQDWAWYCSDTAFGVEGPDIEILKQGPLNDDYWDTWISVVDNVYYVIDGRKYVMYEDQDLFLVDECYLESDEFRERMCV